MAALNCSPISFFFPIHSPKRTVRPLAALSTAGTKVRVPFQLKQGQSCQFHELPSGLRMEVIVQKNCSTEKEQDSTNKIYEPSDTFKGSGNLPLVFVHGSYHAAWCWAENWMPYFSKHGFDCYAISLLGQGESDSPSGNVAGTLENCRRQVVAQYSLAPMFQNNLRKLDALTHAGDVAHFIEKELSLPPVLVGHSFGGLIVQYYIANTRNEQKSENGISYPELAGAVLVCSVPPSGNSGLVWRYILSKPIAAFKVTYSLAAKAFQTSIPLCKETFFSSQMEDSLVLRYQELMKESSRMPLFDLRKLNASLPVPRVPTSSSEVLVAGAADDFIVDAEGLDETGRFYSVSPICVEGVAHDMMLDCLWERGAEVILSRLHSIVWERRDPL